MKNKISKNDDRKFWSTVRRHAVSIGQMALSLALTLYYCLQDPDTPAGARAIIIGAFAYLVLPADAIPDFLPGGFVDDAGALVAAAGTVAVHIKREHRVKAEEQLQVILG